MKLRLQSVDMLPESTKAGADGLHGKGAFGTAMEEMMARSGSGPSRVETPNALLRQQPQIGSYPGTAQFGQGSDDLSGDIHAPKELPAGGPFAHLTLLAEQSAQTKEQSSQTPDAKVSSLLGQPPPELMRQSRTGPAPHMQGPAVQALRAKSHDVARMKAPSPHESHKAATMRNAQMHPVDAQGTGLLPVVLQPIDGAMPTRGSQPDRPASRSGESMSAPLASNSKALSGQVRIQTSRGPGYGNPHGTPLRASAAETISRPPKAVSFPGGNASQSVGPDINGKNSTEPQLSLQSSGKVRAGAVTPSNPPFRLQAGRSTDGVEADTKQADMRALQDTEKKIGTTEVQPDVKSGGAGYPAPTPPIAQHPVLPNVASAVTHGAEKAMASHPETSATQVLQKMDFAGASGPVQLRMDARRLDVGVSSSALGWVEVRATAGASGRVDATLHVQNEASAQVLADQSREISDYAREHSVQLGDVSVGVGTGDNTQERSQSTHTPNANETRVRKPARPLANAEQAHYVAEAVSLISVRA
jgi:hypothetical protein